MLETNASMAEKQPKSTEERIEMWLAIMGVAIAFLGTLFTSFFTHNPKILWSIFVSGMALIGMSLMIGAMREFLSNPRGSS